MSKCCSNSPKSEPVKVAAATIETAAEQPIVESGKNECCDDRSAKSEKRGCGCDC
jgi:hypothetical protein